MNIWPVEKPQSGRYIKAGGVTVSYTFCCSVCEADEIFAANNLDQAMDFASNNGWRLSRDRGWTHKRCCRPLPNFKLSKESSQKLS